MWTSVRLGLSRFRKILGEDESLWVHGAALDVTARHEAEDLRRRLEGEHARAVALEESRAGIVEAGDEARRRLERDLHDGAQQRLVVSLMTLRRAAGDAAGTPAPPFLDQRIEHLEHGLADPLEAIGGSLELESPPGGGTMVRARVPVGSRS